MIILFSLQAACLWEVIHEDTSMAGRSAMYFFGTFPASMQQYDALGTIVTRLTDQESQA